MKGAAFLKPIEWQIDVIGESWQQGAQVKGVIRAKNAGSSSETLSGGLQLAYADMKKVHSRDEKAFKKESEIKWVDVVLAPGATHEQTFEFTLPVNCGVTDKKSSYYLAYGPTLKEANLQLNITPRQLFLEITKLFETFQRFKPKEIKTAKDAVEFKMIPPTSRDFAHVETLHLLQSLDGDKLNLDFTFKVKVLDTKSVTTKVAKDEKHLVKSLTPREYSLGRDMINQDGILKALEEVLSQVRMKGL